MFDSVSENDSSSNVVESRSSVLLNVEKVMSFSGRGVGHLFLHLLSFTGLWSVLLQDVMLGSWPLVVMELIWYGVGLCLYLCWVCVFLAGLFEHLLLLGDVLLSLLGDLLLCLWLLGLFGSVYFVCNCICVFLFCIMLKNVLLHSICGIVDL